MIEIRWNKYEVSLASPILVIIIIIDIIIICQLNSHCPTQRNLAVSTALDSFNKTVLLLTVYSQAQGCACAALQLGGDVKQPCLMSKHGVIHFTGST